ncbi:hypothetical protein E2C01_095154 [Portunus trituberculatus]|uniref:Uncharacterized protein n=1 Tax=Portunus trituberculatus TaxID=210409 RepID=A0A5B7JZ89_PORTR|nr:hypothetical protein [Portunus trituberculatus]
MVAQKATLPHPSTPAEAGRKKEMVPRYIGENNMEFEKVELTPFIISVTWPPEVGHSACSALSEHMAYSTLSAYSSHFDPLN